jgi:large subunit ribosomal protein L4
MKLNIIDSKGDEIGAYNVSIKDETKEETRSHCRYLVKKYQDAYYREGTASTKTRSEVSGGGSKPYKQKGTGRARRGTSRSPLIRGGAIVFGPHPRDYKIKLNNKIIKNVIKGAFVEQEKKTILLSSEVGQDQIKTKEMVALIKGFTKVAVILDDNEENIWKAARNLKKCVLLNTKFLPIATLLSSDKLIITTEAMKKMEATILK